MYELLSVAETAGPEEIKAAYRRQARRWHPDTCRGADSERSYFVEKFIRAREAYEVLSDPELRQDYDRALLQTAGGWAGAVGGGVMFRRGRRRGGERGFGGWESQLEELGRRRSGREGEEEEAPKTGGGGVEESWGSRARRGYGSEFSI